MNSPPTIATPSVPTKKIEDPIRIEFFTQRVRALPWDDAHRRGSLQALFDAVAGLALAEIGYYYKRRIGSRLRSRICRIGAWVCGTVGVLVPVIKIWVPVAWPDFLSVGYVAFGLAGALLLADTSFAGTTAFQRYVKTQLEVERLYALFGVEWQGLMLAFESAIGNDALIAAQALIARAGKFVDAVHQALGSETASWKSDMDAAVKELHKQGARQVGHP